MQVSNSTGRNTDYRVGVSGGGGGSFSYAANSGGTHTATSLFNGLLAPGSTELCVGSWPCTVQFTLEDGTVVVSEEFTQDPGQVALVETNDGYSIEVTPCEAEDGYVAA